MDPVDVFLYSLLVMSILMAAGGLIVGITERRPFALLAGIVGTCAIALMVWTIALV